MKNIFFKILQCKKASSPPTIIPSTLTTAPSSSHRPPVIFNSSDWLRRAKRFDSQIHVRVLLIQIFRAPDDWWLSFISCCDDVLRNQYRHLEIGTVPNEWKEEMWNTFEPDQMEQLREEYGAALKRKDEDSGEMQAMGVDEMRRCVNWIMFCLEELRVMGHKCVW
ncbi:hypothetical protein MFRU_005g04270 [Monilinia fructicola]|nr:hypothetical protein MFRU_005g04270 [Monilinia fructicola]